MEEVKTSEKERLELLEKRIEIKKKRMEIQKEKLSIGDLSERKLNAMDEQEILIAKITELRHLLSDITVDGDRTLFAGEPFLTTVILGENRQLLTNKLISLIKKL
jgi:hypothetical protein